VPYEVQSPFVALTYVTKRQTVVICYMSILLITQHKLIRQNSYEVIPIFVMTTTSTTTSIFNF